MWSGPIITQIPDINYQHERLINLFYGLQRSLVNNTTAETLTNVLKELIAYSQYHFATEEHYFKKYDYPRAEGHILEHNQFRSMINEIKNNIDHSDLKKAVLLLKYLENWINEHMITADQDYDEYLKQFNLRGTID